MQTKLKLTEEWTILSTLFTSAASCERFCGELTSRFCGELTSRFCGELTSRFCGSIYSIAKLRYLQYLRKMAGTKKWRSNAGSDHFFFRRMLPFRECFVTISWVLRYRFVSAPLSYYSCWYLLLFRDYNVTISWVPIKWKSYCSTIFYFDCFW